MLDIYKFNAEAVICIGDIHGDFNGIVGYIKQHDIKNSIIIVCGDVGIGFNKDQYYKETFAKITKKTLVKYNDYVILIRGNHDKKECFDNKLYNTKRIKAVPDYSIISMYPMDDPEMVTLPFNVLCVGGAISIDRKWRKAKNNSLSMQYMFYHYTDNSKSVEELLKESPRCYWEDEPNIYDEIKLAEIKENGLTIDAVATHTAPSFCEPTTKDGITSFLKEDIELESDLTDERSNMDKLYNKLIEDKHPISVWCYGHFHYHKYQNINNIRFFLLDMERNGKIDGVELFCNRDVFKQEGEE